MAVTDPTAIEFVNGKVRPMANNMAQLYYMAKAVIDEYNARGGASFIPNNAGEIIDDGADSDGRPVINGQNVTRFGAILANEIIAAFEANSSEKLKYILAIANRTTSLEALSG